MRKTKYEHSRGFYIDRFNRYKKQMRALDSIPTIKNVDDFAINYESIRNENIRMGKSNKNIVGDIVEQDAYTLDYRTSRRLASTIKEYGGKITNLREFRKLSYDERMDKYGSYIKEFYEQLKATGASKSQAAEIISEYWFGSK